MYVAARLREFREAKNLSQGDIEQRTGLLRCYISRVENGHTVPVLETLEKFCRALEVPLYQLFYEDAKSIELPIKPLNSNRHDWASQGKGQRMFSKLREALSRMSVEDRQLLLFTASRMIPRKRKRKK